MAVVQCWSPVFEPANGEPVEFEECELVYTTEFNGVRLAFVQGYCTASVEWPKRLKTGQIGRFTNWRGGSSDPRELVLHDTIEPAMLAWIARIGALKEATRYTLVFTEVVPTHAPAPS